MKRPNKKKSLITAEKDINQSLRDYVDEITESREKEIITFNQYVEDLYYMENDEYFKSWKLGKR